VIFGSSCCVEIKSISTSGVASSSPSCNFFNP
jgi:hypothetical protein